MKICGLSTALLTVAVSFTYISNAQYLKIKQDEKTKLFGFIDQNNNYVVKPQYKEVESGIEWPEGKTLFYVKNEKDFYGFVNAQGRVVISCKYDEVQSFENGYCVVSRFQKAHQLYGIIDSTGIEVVPVKYKEASVLKGGKRFIIKSDESVALVDNQNNFIVPFGVYQELKAGGYSGSRGSLISCQNKEEKWAVMDVSGKPLTGFKYESAALELHGLVKITINNLVGYVDENGKEAIAATYVDGWDASENYIVVKKGDKWGVISFTNKQIYSFEFDNISVTSGNLVSGKIKGRDITIEIKGNSAKEYKPE